MEEHLVAEHQRFEFDELRPPGEGIILSETAAAHHTRVPALRNHSQEKYHGWRQQREGKTMDFTCSEQFFVRKPEQASQGGVADSTQNKSHFQAQIRQKDESGQ